MKTRTLPIFEQLRQKCPETKKFSLGCSTEDHGTNNNEHHFYNPSSDKNVMKTRSLPIFEQLRQVEDHASLPKLSYSKYSDYLNGNESGWDELYATVVSMKN